MSKFPSRLYRAIRNFLLRNRPVVVTVAHLVLAALANVLAFLIRFEGVIPPEQVSNMFTYLPYLIIIRFLFYYRTRLYRDLWRYTSVGNMIRIVSSVSLGTGVFLVMVRHLFENLSYPRSIYILDWMLLVLIYSGARLFVRTMRELMQSEPVGKPVLVIGAGDAGAMLVRDMKHNPQYSYIPIGFIDDNPYKKGLTIHGVPILGTVGMIEGIVERYRPEEILISMPSASQRSIRDAYEACKPFNLPIKTLPTMSDILDGKVSVSQIKPLSMEDLLQREPVRTDIQSVRDYIGGKAVMVTGAGGSIGTELSRQIINYHPSRLIMLDRYENGLFQVDMELRRLHPSENMVSVIGDITDREGLRHVFAGYNPEVIFHAAAHKHVPLMETNPIEAVKNNILGTRNLIDVSMEHGVESFVMVSTDKAVNPTNIMGATKRVAELLVLDAASHSDVKFTTVRFGNVLGSNGSVIHIFKEQIERGGPVTVTHPEIRRFFMLIPEAVQLVLIAASSGRGGEIFVLDMGEPIRILDFAENVIRLSGFVPGEDIKIEFTGLRPGEKLYEEIFDESEEMVTTSYEKLRIAVAAPPSSEELDRCLSSLESGVRDASVEGLIAAIREVVPGYRSGNPGPIARA